MDKIDFSDRYFYNVFKDKGRNESGSSIRFFNSNVITLYAGLLMLLPTLLFLQLFYKDISYSQNNSNFTINWVTPFLFVTLIAVSAGATYYGFLTYLHSKRDSFRVSDNRKEMQQKLHKLESLLIDYKEKEISRTKLTITDNNEEKNESHSNTNKYWKDYDEILDKYERFFN